MIAWITSAVVGLRFWLDLEVQVPAVDVSLVQCPRIESNDLLLLFRQTLGPPKLPGHLCERVWGRARVIVVNYSLFRSLRRRRVELRLL